MRNTQPLLTNPEKGRGGCAGGRELGAWAEVAREDGEKQGRDMSVPGK